MLNPFFKNFCPFKIEKLLNVLGIKNGVDIIQTVQDDGKYNNFAKGFEGEHIYKVDGKISNKLDELSKLLFKGTLRYYRDEEHLRSRCRISELNDFEGACLNEFSRLPSDRDGDEKAE